MDSAHVNGHAHLAQLHLVVLAVTRNAEIDIDLYAGAVADRLCGQAFVIDVRRNRNRTLCNSFHDELDRTVFLFGNRFDLRRDDTALCGIHLRCIISHGLLILLRNKIYIASGVREIKILLWHAVRSVRSIVPHFGGRQVREWLQMRPIAFPFWEGGPPLCGGG